MQAHDRAMDKDLDARIAMALTRMKSSRSGIFNG